MSLRDQSLDSSGFLPQAVEELLRTWSYRCAGGGLGAIAVLIYLCLATWTGESSGDLASAPNNAFGPLGSIIADLLFQGLGLASVFALLPLVFFGIELFRYERVALLSARLVFWPLSIGFIAGGLSAVPTVPAWPLQHGFGGLTGDFLFGFARQILDTFEPSLGGFIAAILLWIGGLSLLCRTLNLRPRDLLILLEFDPRTRSGSSDIPDMAEHVAGATSQPQPAVHSAQRKRGLFRGLFSRRPAARRRNNHGQQQSGPPHDAPASFREQPAHVPVHDVYEAEPAPIAMTGVQSELFEPRPMAPPPIRHVQAPVTQAPSHVRPDPHDVYRDGREETFEPRLSPDVVDPAEDIESRAMAARFAPDAGRKAKPSVAQPEPVSLTEQPAPQPVVAPLVRRPAKRRKAGPFRLPSLKLLARGRRGKTGSEFAENVLRGNARLLEDVLADFGVKGEIIGVHPGPVVTLYELEPARGVKAARVIGLADDIARSMSAVSARVAVVPGKNAIGIELPNVKRDTVLLRDLLEDKVFAQSDAVLPMAIGKAIDGTPVVTDLARMPHLLVAGTTGSGKSVGINAMILSLLYRHPPSECRFIMIDPKMLELSVYNGIPHLLTPVVTDPRKAVLALNWAVREMEERYKRMSELGVRNMAVYNARLADAARDKAPIHRTVQTGFDRETGEPVYENRMIDHTPMPCIVIVIDEMADLMMTAGKDIEATIQRLAQMARAAGIHLITATQRPSVDVITGTIKANLPTRISFKVTTATDSRTILGQQGAEQLLGAGDMLYSQGGGQIARVHGPFVSEDEVEAVVTHLSAQGAAEYVPDITEEPGGSDDDASAGGGGSSNDVGSGELYDKAVAIVLRDGKASTSYVQRRLSIGYNRAADLIERMEADGIISPAGNTGRREILAERA